MLRKVMPKHIMYQNKVKKKKKNAFISVDNKKQSTKFFFQPYRCVSIITIAKTEAE